MPKIEIKSSNKSINIDEYLLQQKNVKDLSVKDLHENKQETISESERRLLKKEARYYLPVLYLNDPTQWDSKPLSERKYFTDEVAKNTCLGNCCGHAGLRAGCCQLDPDDLEHVLGPIDEEWIKSIIKEFKGNKINVNRHDFIIDFEEGKLVGEKFFNNHPVFQTPESYPMMRFQVNGIRFSCKFLNVNNGTCTIYQSRPKMCREYLCNYVKTNFLIKIPNTNTYKKLL